MSPNRESGPGAKKPGKTRQAASDAPATESLSFEVAYRELQDVVEQLESGQLELERAVVLFERGSQLVQTCERIVDQAQLRVTRLAAESAPPLVDLALEP